MAISHGVREALSSSSLIRKMFEEGRALKARHGAANVFDFSLGNPDLPPPPAFYTVLRELAADATPGAHGYMPNGGFPDVCAALAQKVSREQGVVVPAERIVMSVGAAGALNAAFKAILNPGDTIIVPAPFFPEYRAYCANHGGTLFSAASAPDFSLDVDAIAAALTPATAAVLINSPHNPTGRVYNDGALAQLADALNAHEKKTGRRPWLIADEPYREIVYDGVSVPSVFAHYRGTMIINSYSKNLSLPGERIGFIAVHPEADDAALLTSALIYATRTLGFVNAPALMQRCVARLTGERVDVAVYQRRRDAFIEVLDAAGLSYVKPEGAFYLFARVPPRHGAAQDENGDDAAFAEALKRALILGVPGSGFGARGWIRFAYCVSEETIRASKDAFVRAAAEWRDG